ncbi:DUF1330 domain-containing protein [uncultured Arthrobacter sp.]|uniref:DUF1330 domain-containing protein n=1 Tax=uncultured Arthrobacter sp. TaxID=114050 RepID=UPI0025F828D0|nr:DUF1330 domain-containing protein [uncultured Arthrobacter sp.]
MSAYVVMIRKGTSDDHEMATYRTMAKLAREGHEVTPIAAYGELDVLEGDDLDGVAINRFPSMDAAREWYNSDRYQQAMIHRHRGADYQVFVIDGVDQP